MSERFNWTGLSDRQSLEELIRTLNVRMPRNARAMPRRIVADFRDYNGADPLGNHDNAASLQRWMNDAATAGAVAWLPEGSWAYDTMLEMPSGFELDGAGWNAILKPTWSLVTEGGAVYLINADTTNGNSNIRLRNIRIQGPWAGGPLGNPSPTRAGGVLFRRGSNVKVVGVQIDHVPAIAMAHQGITAFRAISNYLHDGGRDGITGGPFGTSPSDDVLIALNHVLDHHDDHIACNMSVDTATPGTTPPRRWTIAGNTLRGGSSLSADNFARGIMVHGGEDITIGLNNAKDTSWMTLMVLADPVTAQRCANIKVIGNRLRNAGQVGTNLGGHGARLDSIDELLFVGNGMKGAKGYGVFMTECTEWTVDENSVTYCGQALDGVGFGMWLSGTSAGDRDVKRGQCNGNRVAYNDAGGIYAKNVDTLDLMHNACFNNGQAAVNDTYNAGIIVEGAGRVRAHGNNCYDDQGSKTQRYGFVTKVASMDYLSLKDNYLEGNLTAPLSLGITPTTLVRRGNQLTTGAVSGRAVLVNGTVTVTTAEVQASDNITLTRVVAAGTTQGLLRVGTIVAGTSFVIEATDLAGALSADDDSTVFWEITH